MLKSKLLKPRFHSPPFPPPPPPLDPSPSRHRHRRILSLLKQCTTLRCFKQIHAHMLTRAVRKPNDLLARLLLLGDLPYSLLLFSQNHRPNEFSFNLVIRALVTLYSRFPLALEFYLRMLRSGLRPDHYTFPFVLLAAANLQSLHHGLASHASIFKVALHDVDHVQHSLLTMYARCGQVALARKLFDEIAVRDSVSWNSMLSGYAKMGCAGEAVELFRRMRSEGLVEPDEVTLVSVLAACGDLGDASLGMWLEELVGEYGLVLNSFLGSSLIDMYGKCGDLDSARRVFDRLAKKDLVAWNAMISGYAQNGLSDEAIKLFHTMRKKGIEPDKITIVGVLSACASIGALELGISLDAYASRNDLYNNVYVGTALVDMYAKCGNLGRAMEVFENLPHRNLFTWNAIISAFAFNGQGQESISLFSWMLADKQGLLPDDITFISLLSACVHSGLVDEGRRLFSLMQTTYGIVPKIEHYSCMVDLFARSGLLDEAWEFLEKMPQKPDAVALGAMLSACRYHKNAKIGEKIAKRILELEPSNSGNYVISSKMFAGSKRWKDSARMIGLMRERGIAKTPGCSWIEVGDQVHEFHAGDRLHLRATEIFDMIDLVVDEMKMEGYTPTIN